MDVAIFMIYEEMHYFEFGNPVDKMNDLVNLAHDMFSTCI